MTADEFEAWMKSRQVKVATGKPGQPRSPVPTRTVLSPLVAPAVAVPTAVVPARAEAPGAEVTLQIAAFAAHANAERALAMLHDAGIGNARLFDAEAAGQKVWRLRVGPVDSAAVAELSSRVRGLGFGPPHVVRDERFATRIPSFSGFLPGSWSCRSDEIDPVEIAPVPGGRPRHHRGRPRRCADAGHHADDAQARHARAQ